MESVRKALALVPEISFLLMNGKFRVYSRHRLFAIVSEGELFLKAYPETQALFRDTTPYAYPGIGNTFKANPEWLQEPEKLGEFALYMLAIRPPSRPENGPLTAGPRGAAWWLARLPWEKALAGCAALAALYFLLPYTALRAVGIQKGVKAGNLTLTGLHGETRRLSECGGKPVFLYVWETYSQRSVDNMPMLDALYAEYKNKRVCFMPVSANSDFNCDVRALAKAKGIKYPVYNAAGQLRPAKQAPMLYLIDHEGYIRESYSPSLGDRTKIASALEGLLRDAPNDTGSKAGR